MMFNSITYHKSGDFACYAPTYRTWCYVIWGETSNIRGYDVVYYDTIWTSTQSWLKTTEEILGE